MEEKKPPCAYTKVKNVICENGPKHPSPRAESPQNFITMITVTKIVRILKQCKHDIIQHCIVTYIQRHACLFDIDYSHLWFELVLLFSEEAHDCYRVRAASVLLYSSLPART